MGFLSRGDIGAHLPLSASDGSDQKEDQKEERPSQEHGSEDRENAATPPFLILLRMSEEKSPQKDWYESWFDSPYYHILYKDRDEEEAAFFVDRLVERLNPREGARILDLACGRGRHAIQLHRKGFDVTGLDLSENSISVAKEHEAPGLRFDTHDMRHIYDRAHPFDKILNLFSSFGYFRSEGENFRVIKSAAEQLKKGGELVIDFMNAQKAIQTLIPHEVKRVEGIDFHIHRYVDHGRLIKRIAFHDQGKDREFKEKLRILFDNDLQVMLERAGMKVEDRYGDYALTPFDRRNSDRLIIIARRS